MGCRKRAGRCPGGKSGLERCRVFVAVLGVGNSWRGTDMG